MLLIVSIYVSRKRNSNLYIVLFNIFFRLYKRAKEDTIIQIIILNKCDFSNAQKNFQILSFRGMTFNFLKRRTDFDTRVSNCLNLTERKCSPCFLLGNKTKGTSTLLLSLTCCFFLAIVSSSQLYATRFCKRIAYVSMGDAIVSLASHALLLRRSLIFYRKI